MLGLIFRGLSSKPSLSEELGGGLSDDASSERESVGIRTMSRKKPLLKSPADRNEWKQVD